MHVLPSLKCIHICSAAARHHGLDMYLHMHYTVWVALVALPVAAGSALALTLNAVDRTAYRRHVTMLRLEFDTKLGMHSPK